MSMMIFCADVRLEDLHVWPLYAVYLACANKNNDQQNIYTLQTAWQDVVKYTGISSHTVIRHTGCHTGERGDIPP